MIRRALYALWPGRSGLQQILFLLITAAIVVVPSERMFWYYSSYWPQDYVWLVLFYAFAVGAFLWAVDRFGVRGWWSLVLAVPIFAWTVEGVITPVMYESGPIPFFPIWFAFWHGGLGLVVAWYLFRRWLVHDRWGRILAASIGIGVFWAWWALTMQLPGNLNDPIHNGDARVFAADEFAIYVSAFTVVLMAGHWLFGKGLWAPRFRPPRWVIVTWLAIVGLTVVVWTFFVFWALPVFVICMGAVLVGLKRLQGGEQRSFLAELEGPASWKGLLAMLAIPAVAAPLHWLLLEQNFSETFIQDLAHDSTIFVQFSIGTVLLGIAGWRAYRAGRVKPPAAGSA